MKYTTIDRVLAGIFRDVKPVTPIEEGDVIEWAGEALDFIGVPSQYQEAVEFIEVSGYKGLLPAGLHHVLQVAYTQDVTPPQCCPSNIIEGTETYVSSCTTGTTAALAASTGCSDCDGTDGLYATLPQDSVKLSSFREYYAGLLDQVNIANTFTEDWRPLRMSTSTMRMMGAKCPLYAHPTPASTYGVGQEYVLEEPYIRVTFEKGWLAMAFLRYPLDERGIPLIPDDNAYVKAITSYVTYMAFRHDFIYGHINPGVYQKLESDWQWYCGVAANRQRLPKTIDALENIRSQRMRLLPRVDRYYGFFGQLAANEIQVFRDY